MTAPANETEISRAACAIVASYLEDELDILAVSEMLESVETALDIRDSTIIEAVQTQANAYLADFRALLLAPQRYVLSSEQAAGGAE